MAELDFSRLSIQALIDKLYKHNGLKYVALHAYVTNYTFVGSFEKLREQVMSTSTEIIDVIFVEATFKYGQKCDDIYIKIQYGDDTNVEHVISRVNDIWSDVYMYALIWHVDYKLSLFIGIEATYYDTEAYTLHMYTLFIYT